MPSPSTPWGRMEGGGREQRQVLAPLLQSSSIVVSSRKGQLLCLAAPPVFAVWMFIRVRFRKFGSNRLLKKGGVTFCRQLFRIIANFLSSHKPFLSYFAVRSLRTFIHFLYFPSFLFLTSVNFWPLFPPPIFYVKLILRGRAAQEPSVISQCTT